MSDNRIRSFTKALSWRVLATATTVTLCYLVTRSVKAATAIGLLEATFKIFLYYLHERLWAALPEKYWPTRFKPASSA